MPPQPQLQVQFPSHATGYDEINLTEDRMGMSVSVQVLEPKPLKLEEVPTADDKGNDNSMASNSRQRVLLLLYCCLGTTISFSLNNLVLEKLTTHRVVGELSLTCFFCLFYAITALALRAFAKEPKCTAPQSRLALVGLLAFGSTICSMVALRYVTFITRILGKSCKSIPVMIMGVVLGKKYALKKYVSVLLLSIGVAVFLLSSGHHHHQPEHVVEVGTAGAEVTVAPTEPSMPVASGDKSDYMVFGIALLLVSLLFDGATGALEDQLLEKYHIGAFDLMYIVNIWKSVFAFVGMVCAGEVQEYMDHAVETLPSLLLLSATGALGQAFIFYTISQFGALTTTVIGTCRKVVSIALSVVFFGHVLSLEQVIGLLVAFCGISCNWLRLPATCGATAPATSSRQQSEEMCELLVDDNAESLSKDGSSNSSDDDTLEEEEEEEEEDDEVYEDKIFKEDQANDLELQRGLELVQLWEQQQQKQQATIAASTLPNRAFAGAPKIPPTMAV